jgi:hypothetical protein
MLRRALLRGQSKRHTATFAGIAKSCVAAGVYTLGLPIFLLIGQHLFIRHLISWCDHVGKLIGVLGFTPMGDKYLTPQECSVRPEQTQVSSGDGKAAVTFVFPNS